MYLAVRIVQRFVGTKVFQSVGAASTGRRHPYCSDTEYDSDEYWECFIKHNTMTMFDPVGTCKMGPATDPTAVVDTKLRYSRFVTSFVKHTAGNRWAK